MNGESPIGKALARFNTTPYGTHEFERMRLALEASGYPARVAELERELTARSERFAAFQTRLFTYWEAMIPMQRQMLSHVSPSAVISEGEVSELAKLRTANAALAKDAERWKAFVQITLSKDEAGRNAMRDSLPEDRDSTPDDMNRAIDAAIASQSEQQK